MMCKCKKGMAYTIRLIVETFDTKADEVEVMLDGQCKRCGHIERGIEHVVDDQGFCFTIADMVRRVMPKGVDGKTIRTTGVPPVYAAEVRAALRKRGVK